MVVSFKCSLVNKLLTIFFEQEKKTLQKFWCTKKTFRLSSRTPFGYLLTSCNGPHIISLSQTTK